MDNAMSEQPKEEITCGDIINGKLHTRLVNLIIEECALCCDAIAQLAHGDLSWSNSAHACAEDVRKLKKQEDSGG